MPETVNLTVVGSNPTIRVKFLIYLKLKMKNYRLHLYNSPNNKYIAMDIVERFKDFVSKNNIKLLKNYEEKDIKVNNYVEFECTYKYKPDENGEEKTCKKKARKTIKYLICGKASTMCISHTDYCIHYTTKSTCKECCGGSICEHNTRKQFCRKCKGSSFCEHNTRKQTCKQCHGSGICEHNIRRVYCKDCKGSSICIHQKNKAYCKDCDGRQLCKSSWCESKKIEKYNGYCMRCFINLFPGEKISYNYKTKQNDVTHFIVNNKDNKDLPECKWISDKIISGGCSKRRPDLFADLITHSVIIEIDENKHNDYDQICENKRTMEIFRDLGNRPVVFIRFNPDNYVKKNGTKVSSCWGYNKEGEDGEIKLTIKRNKKSEWSNRLQTLYKEVERCMKDVPEKEVTVVHLFYDGYD